MSIPAIRVALSAITVAGLALAISAQKSRSVAQTEPVITVQGQPFYSWSEYTHSHVFQQLDLRCGTKNHGELRQPPADCNLSSSTIKPEYAPGFVHEVPVVVHILQHTNGNGQISDALVQSQIDVLNEDFQALPGTNGANGNDAKIRFYLAQTDPGGHATTGITRTTNNTWYNDAGNYWDPLAWDTSRYLNIYTNLAGGNLGYVSGFPAQGIAGQNSDRVVILWPSFGRNGPIGPPYNQGRTTTHEVGHYFGLYHTFQGGCAPVGACYTSGDLICDTNAESSPNFGCPASRTTCGTSDPIQNYMDYSDDLCMELFTVEQVNRMRCSIDNWRSGLPCSEASVVHRNAGPNLDILTVTTPALGLQVDSVVDDVGSTAYNTVLFLIYLAPLNAPLGNGQILLVDTASGRIAQTALPKTSPTVLTLTVPNSISLCGLVLYSQAALYGGAAGFVLTNAQDWTIGM